MYNVQILKRLDQVQGSWCNKFRILGGRVETFIRFHCLTFTSYLLHLYPCAPKVQNVRNTSTAVRSRTLGMFYLRLTGLIEFAQTASTRVSSLSNNLLRSWLRHVATCCDTQVQKFLARHWQCPGRSQSNDSGKAGCGERFFSLTEQTGSTR